MTADQRLADLRRALLRYQRQRVTDVSQAPCRCARCEARIRYADAKWIMRDGRHWPTCERCERVVLAEEDNRGQQKA